MRERKTKNKGYKRYIIVGFLAVYIVSMFLATYLMKENYITVYQTEAQDIINNAIQRIESVDIKTETNGSKTEIISYMKTVLSSYICSSSEFSMVGVGIYSEDGELLTTASNCFHPIWLTSDRSVYSTYDFDSLFNEEEKEKLKKYYIDEWEQRKKAKSYEELDLYDCSSFYDANGTVVNFEIRKTNEQEFCDTLFFSWRNPDFKSGKQYSALGYSQTKGYLIDYISLPYLQYGEDAWQKWQNDEYLHNYNFDDETAVWYNSYVPVETGKYTYKYLNGILQDDYDESYILQLNQRIYPWHAAADYLKYIYILCALLFGACTIYVLYFTDKIYKKQDQLEQTRRDFTNAVAHELKTPLSIVRGLAETMEETTSEHKKSFYRAEIVNQTEVMDGLVKEMILISKMDSEQMILKKEPVSILALMEEQIDKLSLLIDEKNLQIQYWKDEDFIITGDRIYLEKAFSNLLENAVSYNKPDGGISIHLEKDSCIIENTAAPIPEEDLPHVCEMFFTSNKSRTTDAKHKGLGLYLTKRILDMHGIGFKIENTDIGVKVTLVRK